jgi:hypothetical protein
MTTVTSSGKFDAAVFKRKVALDSVFSVLELCVMPLTPNGVHAREAI